MPTQRTGRMWLMDPPAPPLTRTPAGQLQLLRLDATAALEVGEAFGPAAAMTFTWRLNQNSRRAYGAICDGQLAALGWVSFTPEPIGEQGLTLRLRPGEAYVWDCFTRPAFRGRGLYRALVAYVAGALMAEGVRRVWIGADLSNEASQRGIAAAGYKPVADLAVAPLGSRELLWLEAVPGATAAEVAAAQYALFGERARPPRL